MSLTAYGNSLLNNGKNNSTSTKYVTVYPSNDSGITDLDIASEKNYAKNTQIYGDAIRETSSAGIERNSWYLDYSCYASSYNPFFIHGGGLMNGSGAGLFSFNLHGGNSFYYDGFRTVLIAK